MKYFKRLLIIPVHEPGDIICVFLYLPEIFLKPKFTKQSKEFITLN